MSVGDLALFYHSNEGREIVGVARVVRGAYADPTSDDDWSVVDVAPVKPLTRPVTLEAVKGDALLSRMALVRRSRLSVAPVEPPEFARVLELGGTRLR
jgi:predicted RNA-binding protein with PUA-like domain